MDRVGWMWAYVGLSCVNGDARDLFWEPVFSSGSLGLLYSMILEIITR